MLCNNTFSLHSGADSGRLMKGPNAAAKKSVIAISVTAGGVAFICILADVIALVGVVTVP